MITSRQIFAAAAFMAIAGVPHAQTAMDAPKAPAAGTAMQSDDPLVQKRQADKEAKAKYKAEKKAAKKNYKSEKKAAKSELKEEKAESTAERKEKLGTDPMAPTKP
jgi:hypothetical protein